MLTIGALVTGVFQESQCQARDREKVQDCERFFSIFYAIQFLVFLKFGLK